MRVCSHLNCVAVTTRESGLCAVHEAVTRRASTDAQLHCYACGELIRIGARWLVRPEGAFHLRVECITQSPDTYATKLLPGAAPYTVDKWVTAAAPGESHA